MLLDVPSTPVFDMGMIHSVETFGALDGPGLRYVVFLQGCPLKCVYCHNPDACGRGGIKKNAEEIVEDAEKFRSFLRGITLSGGEPLSQAEFCKEIIDLAKKRGLHTAIDTSGGVWNAKVQAAVLATDLIILDIKAYSDELCIKVSGKDNKSAKKFLQFCEDNQKPVWIRHVVVPTLTLDEAELTKLANYLKPFSCIERIELLPFHKMGEYKWENLGLEYTLKEVPPPSSSEMEAARKIFSDRGLPIRN